MTLMHYLILAAVLFSIGLYGAISKRNAVVILMCIEVMLNAVCITFVAFSRYIIPALLTGHIFVIFIIVVAAAEATVGLAIIISIYRTNKSVDATKVDLLKW